MLLGDLVERVELLQWDSALIQLFTWICRGAQRTVLEMPCLDSAPEAFPDFGNWSEENLIHMMVVVENMTAQLQQRVLFSSGKAGYKQRK